MRLTLKDALRDGLYKRICLRTGEEWTAEKEAAWEASLRKRYGAAAEEELDVVPARGSGIYISRAAIRQCMSPALPVIRFACPDGFELQSDEYRTDFVLQFLRDEVAPYLADFDLKLRSYFGQDFARNGDVSPIAVGQLSGLDIVTRFILEMRNVPFREQELILNWIIERLPLFCAGKMDARGNGSALAEFMQQRWGANHIEAVMASDKTYLAFMPKMKARIEDRTILLPSDEGTEDDISMIKLVRGIPKIPSGSVQSKADGDKGKRHGDNAIAIMHLVAAADEDAGPMDVHVLNQTRSTAAPLTITTTGFGTIRRRSRGMAF